MFKESLRASKQSGIFKEAIEQFGRELTQFFPDKDVGAFLIKTSDEVNDPLKYRTSKDSPFPFFTYRLDSVAPNREKYNRSTLFRNGLIIDDYITTIPGERPDDPNKVYSTLHLTPVDVTFDVIFFCEYNDLYSFIPMWQQAAQNHYLNFQLEAGTQSIPINIEMSEDLSVGEIDPDKGQYAQIVSSVVMSAYHGVESNIRPINSYKMTTGIVSDKRPTAELVPSLQINKRKDTTVFTKNAFEGDT